MDEGLLVGKNEVQAYNIVLHNKDGVTIGTLDFTGPKLKFTGDAEESAKVFVDWVATIFESRFERKR